MNLKKLADTLAVRTRDLTENGRVSNAKGWSPEGPRPGGAFGEASAEALRY